MGSQRAVRHCTPTFNCLRQNSKLRSRSRFCCNFRAAAYSAGFSPGTSAMIMAPEKAASFGHGDEAGEVGGVASDSLPEVALVEWKNERRRPVMISR